MGLFYCRMMMMLALISILGPRSTFNFSSGLRVLQNLDLSLDIFIILMPFFTFIPIEALLRVMLSKNHKEVSPAKKRLICLLKTIKWIALSLMAIFTVVSIYAMIAIGEGSSTEENNELLILFGRTLA